MPRDFWLISYLVVMVFFVTVVLVLVGCWAILAGRIDVNGPALAAIFGLVGTIVGYGFAMSSTVLSTIFGGSITNPHAPRTVTDASTTINASTVGTIDESTTASQQSKASP